MWWEPEPEKFWQRWWEIDKDMGESPHAIWVGLALVACIAVIVVWRCAL